MEILQVVHFVDAVELFAAIYIVAALTMGLGFAVTRKLREREASKHSDKYTAAFAMIYVVERLHGKRLQDSREKVLQAIWAHQPKW